MFKRILVALDSSPEGEAILSEVERIASPSTEFVLLHILPVATPAVGAPPTEILVREDRARGYLEAIVRRLARPRTQTLIRAGDPVKEILTVADETEADAIAMATHARRGLSRLFVGSVAEAVLRKSSRPILFTHARPRGSKDSIRRILVALEAFDTPSRVLEPARKLAKEMGAEIILMQTVAPVVMPQPVAGMPMLPLTEPADPEPKLKLLAEELRNEGLQVRTLIVYGYAAGEIARQAKELQVDLVMMEREVRQGLDKILLNPVSKNLVRRLDRPLLVCPKAAA